jgi:probable HAF family extracellular repeat protein
MLGRLAVSPDGSRLVFVQAVTNAEGNFQYEVMLMNSDGTGLINLSEHPSEDVDPTFTSDGKAVMFSSNREQQSFELYLVPLGDSGVAKARAAAQTGVQKWASLPGDQKEPDWDKSTALSAVPAPQFFRLGFLPGGEYSQATAISSNGAVVVGTAENASFDQHAFRWTRALGMRSIGTLGGTDSEGEGVSADGTIVVGAARNAAGGLRGFRWSTSNNMEGLGTFTGPTSGISFATAVSGDGRILVGWSGDVQGQEQPFRWTRANGIQNIGSLGGIRGIANDANFDGTLVVGRSRNSNQTYRAFLWSSSTGMQELPTSREGASEATAISPDGRFVVGNEVRGAFRWTSQGGTELLHAPAGYESASAVDVSADGNRVVGRLVTESLSTVAAMWTKETGWIDLNRVFAHALPASFILEEITAVGADGRWAVGNADNESGDTEAFLLELDFQKILPLLTRPTLTITGQRSFSFQLMGQPATTYVLESSTNLVHWRAVATNSSGAASFGVTNSPVQSQEYFRVRQVVR